MLKSLAPFLTLIVSRVNCVFWGRLTAVKGQEKASVCKQIKYSLVRDALSLCDY